MDHRQGMRGSGQAPGKSHPRQWVLAICWLLCLFCSLLPCAVMASDWAAASIERGYVLDGMPSDTSNPVRQCTPAVLQQLDRQASVQAPPDGWPGTPQAVVVFNIFRGEVMIGHGDRVACGDMFDARTRDSRFRAGVGQVVVPAAGSMEPILVAWQSPLRPEWVPTIKVGGPSPLQQLDTARLLMRTACMAVGLSLALSALMGWIATRDRVFLYYTASCLLFFVWQAVLTGLAGYPYPWLPTGSWLPQWQVGLTLMVTALMLTSLWYLCAGHLLLSCSRRVMPYFLLVCALPALSVPLLPLPLLRAMAIAPQVLMVLGGVLVVTVALLAQLRGLRAGLLGMLGLIPFMSLVFGELTGARWLVIYRVEIMQAVATWLLMITAYALNRRLGLLRVQRDEMRRLADTDGMTGLPNRRAGMLRLAKLRAEAAVHGQPLSIGFLDVDHFKSINDTYGHDIGDQVLVANVVAVGVIDDVVRMGGEEFLLLLPGVDEAHAAERMEAIRARLAEIQLRAHAPGLSVTASIGVARCRPGDIDAAALLRRADQAMYAAKQAGRNRVQLA
jgi:diguanylate cyclase (GGDEF)-like protein